MPSNVRKLEKGTCLIISQEKYDPDSDHSDRDGTQQDVIALSKTFKSFGCNDRIKVERDIDDAKGFKEVISEFREGLKYQKLDFVVVCILSHGEVLFSGRKRLK